MLLFTLLLIILSQFAEIKQNELEGFQGMDDEISNDPEEKHKLIKVCICMKEKLTPIGSNPFNFIV